eukprot:CAMPEP_0176487696 /NCGR_PEP_ID=MMETSP0200_2-20121128/6284_1 /TAXON_ID=947934 /ORGANISM="Chaetoceros sp., Strain GSL56" /LENGTH=1488 /DNA_ID=CAMNT_0017884571 /DNA_START=158 /DNA_END=4624 /DNA_ORIENTATION=+
MSSKTKSTMSPSSSPGPVVVMDPMRASSSSTENHPNNHNTKNNNNNNNNNARLVSMSPGSYSGSHHASPTSPGNANHHDKNHKNSNNTNNNDKKDTHHNRSSSYDSLSNWSLPGVVIEDDLQYPPNENNSSLISHHTHGDNHSHGHNHDTSKNPVFPFPTMTFDHRYVNVNADADINVNGNGNGHVNHFQQSPKMIRRNPRDAASPRRSRMVVKRQEYNASTSAISPRTTGHWTTMTQHHHPETVVSRGEVITNGTNAAVAIAVGEEAVGSPTDAGNISLASLKTEDTRSMGASSSFVAFGQHANGSGGLLLPFMDNASLSSSSRSRSRTHPTTTTTMTMTTKKNNKSSSGGGGGGSLAGKSQSSNNPMTVSSKSSSVARHVKQKSLDLGQEQILFEQRLCDVNYGVAVRKIHSNGKSQLRYVRCVPLMNATSTTKGNSSATVNSRNNMSSSVPDVSLKKKNGASSSRSVASLMGRISLGSKRSSKYKVTDGNDGENVATVDVDNHVHSTEKHEMKQTMALTWGNKRKVVIPLCNFVEVRKGKTTNRTRKNPNHPSKLLSLLTNDKRHGHGSLDIEAPTKLDRDKFAKAFSVFLDIPLKDDFVGEDVNIEQELENRHESGYEDHIPDDLSSLRSISTSSSVMTPRGMVEYHIGGALLPSLSSSPGSSKDESSKLIMEKKNISLENSSANGSRSVKSSDSLNDLLRPLSTNIAMEPGSNSLLSDVVKPIPDAKKSSKRNESEDDDVSGVSSLTQGYDQEIVEELHQAIKELRVELDASRAEAARAVKVAEQAIQSAESCSSNDWNSTVTHKAAEAAAQAQTRSAEALAKQRLAEEKLAAERKSSSFWRKQAQSAQDQAASLQTRLAVAQVQRAAVVDELDREKNKATTYIKSLKQDYSMQEAIRRDKIANAAEQNRLLEIELDGTRRDLMAKYEEAKSLQDTIAELKSYAQGTGRHGNKKTFFSKGNKKFREPLLLENQINSSGRDDSPSIVRQYNDLHTEELLKIRAEASAVKKQFEVLRRTTQDELGQLPEYAKDWALQASRALNMVQIEVDTLKKQLALEIANRRKLLHEVQDLRGSVRVYCRPLSISNSSETATSKKSIIESPSHDILVLHRDMALKKKGECPNPMCFEFDHVFSPDATQNEVYLEVEELVLGTLEGFKTCFIAYGQTGSGKTHSMIGDFKFSQGDGFGDDAIPTVELTNLGIHLLAARQLFHVSNQRKNMFEDTFNLSILEIRDEKLIDLVARTDVAESAGILNDADSKARRSVSSRRGTITSSDSRAKLEIGTNHEGDTIVQGQVSVTVENFDDVLNVWRKSMAQRVKMIQDDGLSLEAQDRCSHLIATIEIISTNVTTGIGTYGKLQCVDLAASDVTQKRGSNSGRLKSAGMDNILASIDDDTEWKFVNKSISTLADVVDARVNFSRNPPYRNSTLTHVLRDALEADTKTLFFVCVKSGSKDLQDAANSLRLASKIRKVVIGKATKRFLTIA